jgi:hypothetical protein
MAKGGGGSSRPISDNHCKEYNYHDSWACGYKQSGILNRLEGMIWDGFGMIMVMLLDQDDFGIALQNCVIYRNPLCGSHFTIIKLIG